MFIPSFFFATIHIVYLNDFCHSYRATGQFRPFFLIVYYNAATAVHALQNAIQQIDDDVELERYKFTGFSVCTFKFEYWSNELIIYSVLSSFSITD